MLEAGACVGLFAIGLAFYAWLFVHVPILTETRDILFFRGWTASAWDVWMPTGSGYHLSWWFSGWQREILGFDARRINLLQFALLALGALVGYIHLRQLRIERVMAFGAMLLWLFSLGAIHAAFWQATQHDKLAFLFTLLTLCVSFAALHVNRPSVIPILAALVCMLAITAVASKPIGLVLCGALLIQAVLFAPALGASPLRAVAVVGPAVIAITLYGLVYLARMDPGWQAHTLSGDIQSNLLYYMRNITNSEHDGRLWLAVLLLLPVAAAWVRASWRTALSLACSQTPEDAAREPRIGRDAVLAYLCALCIGSVILVIRARHPVPYYLLIPTFAFTASLGVIATSPRREHRRFRAALVSAAVAVGLLAVCQTSLTGDNGLGQARRSARNLAEGYAVLRERIDPRLLDAVTFVLPRDAEGYFYFFSNGAHDGIDPTIPSFIFGDEFRIAMRETSVLPPDRSTGQLVAVWSRDLQLLGAAVKDATVAGTIDAGPVAPPTYRLGELLTFDRGGTGTFFLGSGWSSPEGHGTWSDGTEALVTLELDSAYDAPLEAVVRAEAFASADGPQHVTLFANEQLVAQWSFPDRERETERAATIPAGVAASGRLELRFQFENPRSPADVGASNDRRSLGLALRTLLIRAPSG